MHCFTLHLLCYLCPNCSCSTDSSWSTARSPSLPRPRSHSLPPQSPRHPAKSCGAPRKASSLWGRGPRTAANSWCTSRNSGKTSPWKEGSRTARSHPTPCSRSSATTTASWTKSKVSIFLGKDGLFLASYTWTRCSSREAIGKKSYIILKKTWQIQNWRMFLLNFFKNFLELSYLLQTENSQKETELPTVNLSPDDFECSLCIRMLWQPVNTPCGHTFCRICLNRSLDHTPYCPLCKTSLKKVS